MAPGSPGNCCASRRIARAHLRSQGSSSCGWRWWPACSSWIRFKSLASSASALGGAHFMKLVKSPRRASFLLGSSSHINTASFSSSPMHAANSGYFLSRTTISSIRRKPHMASKGVRAMAISGLWLESPYASGFSACSRSAFRLSGCAWIDRALPADKILNRKGSSPPTADSSVVPSVKVVGALGCVPIQSSAYGADGSTESMMPHSSAYRATLLSSPRMPHA
mmetsp:Transcript_67300/g.152260  ORF Transcript_67300/g.152260 Transcript_67300/m.152260 type:complete len:223 (-) Transcript_67300:106-774(-)